MKVIDPVCNMTIEDKDAAAISTYKGRTYYYCSKSCKEDFDKNPEQFIGQLDKVSAAREAARALGIYTCPMHPEVSKEGPGSCPKCGMALGPRTVSVEEKIHNDPQGP